MRILSWIVLQILLLTTVCAVDKGSLLRKFLYGLSEGIGYPVSHEDIFESGINGEDTNVTYLFASLGQLPYHDPKKSKDTMDRLVEVKEYLTEFWSQKHWVVRNSKNLTETLRLTIITLGEPVNFLRLVNLRHLDHRLGSGDPSQSQTDFVVSMGENLGKVIQECLGTTVSEFLVGLGSG
eukprot:TRINITY_DN11659_c0_g1_i3.p1 TRINITY_DN11659_c0_g1~~TRINITY_DN11659_c0_g1_i3.p1  ORF type:complete len:180 (-),score=10.94 TRINITY_DN11659_c0_g1_i3:308-847(-)